MPKEAKEKAEAELQKLKMMSPMSAEATVVRSYIDWMIQVPWVKRSKVKKDLLKAQEILDSDHYGLERVKERILEYLAVQSRISKIKGPILCLVGPPGVGKTSLGQSIARATGLCFQYPGGRWFTVEITDRETHASAFTSSATASQAIPSLRPVKPSFSVVVAFTLISSI